MPDNCWSHRICQASKPFICVSSCTHAGPQPLKALTTGPQVLMVGLQGGLMVGPQGDFKLLYTKYDNRFMSTIVARLHISHNQGHKINVVGVKGPEW